MKELIGFVCPKNITEKIVLLSLFLFYGAIASYLIFATNTIDNKKLLWDLYLGFDTPSYVYHFFSLPSTIHPQDVDNQNIVSSSVSFLSTKQLKLEHPIFKILMLPVILLSVAIEFLFGYKIKALFLVLFTSLLVSCSLMLIFRYLISFLHLGLKRAYLITVLAAFFSTNLILSFSPESYPISLFLLTFTFVYCSCRIKEKGSIPFYHFFVLTLVTGGTTITNSIKCCIPDWFSDLSLKKKILRTGYVALILTCIFLLVHFTFLLVKGTGELSMPWSDMLQTYSKFSGVYADAKVFTSMVLSKFFGSPILFSEFYIESFNTIGLPEINLRPYVHSWQYLVIFFILGTFAIALFKNYKNRFFLMLILSFLVDIVIHVVFHFGLYEAFIYGGHWIFVVPLIWGWIYTGDKNRKRVLFLDAVFVVLGLIIIFNNSIKLFDFIQFARHYYPN